jgi:hypothetical protein
MRRVVQAALASVGGVVVADKLSPRLVHLA